MHLRQKLLTSLFDQKMHVRIPVNGIVFLIEGLQGLDVFLVQKVHVLLARTVALGHAYCLAHDHSERDLQRGEPELASRRSQGNHRLRDLPLLKASDQ